MLLFDWLILQPIKSRVIRLSQALSRTSFWLVSLIYCVCQKRETYLQANHYSQYQFNTEKKYLVYCVFVEICLSNFVRQVFVNPTVSRNHHRMQSQSANRLGSLKPWSNKIRQIRISRNTSEGMNQLKRKRDNPKSRIYIKTFYNQMEGNQDWKMTEVI